MSDAALREYGALDVFDHVPERCKGVLVAKDNFAPHLRVGEFAVIDTGDTKPVHGEIYLMQVGARLTFVQICRGRGAGIWFRFSEPRPSKLQMIDGPLKPEFWPEKCAGRVVGVIERQGA